MEKKKDNNIFMIIAIILLLALFPLGTFTEAMSVNFMLFEFPTIVAAVLFLGIHITRKLMKGTKDTSENRISDNPEAQQSQDVPSVQMQQPIAPLAPPIQRVEARARMWRSVAVAIAIFSGIISACNGWFLILILPTAPLILICAGMVGYAIGKERYLTKKDGYAAILVMPLCETFFALLLFAFFAALDGWKYGIDSYQPVTLAVVGELAVLYLILSLILNLATAIGYEIGNGKKKKLYPTPVAQVSDLNK